MNVKKNDSNDRKRYYLGNFLISCFTNFFQKVHWVATKKNRFKFKTFNMQPVNNCVLEQNYFFSSFFVHSSLMEDFLPGK